MSREAADLSSETIELIGCATASSMDTAARNLPTFLFHIVVLAVITRFPDGVLLAPSALAARRLASLLEL